MPQWIYEVNDKRNNYEFPGELLDLIKKVHSKEGLDSILKKMQDEIANWTYFADSTAETLASEEERYHIYKDEYAEVWEQVPSLEASKDIRQELEEWKAKTKEGTVICEDYKEKIESDEYLKLLSEDINKLIDIIPASVIISDVVAAPLAAQYDSLTIQTLD